VSVSGDSWFCFERDADFGYRPNCFQSAELDNLFLESSAVRVHAAWCISCQDMRLIFFWGDRVKMSQLVKKWLECPFIITETTGFLYLSRMMEGVPCWPTLSLGHQAQIR
jgi:hypothetical protein